MSSTRYIKAKLFDLTSDGVIIIYGFDKEHLIIDCGPNQIDNLEAAIQKYRKTQQETAA
jgi:hypothetical protein